MRCCRRSHRYTRDEGHLEGRGPRLELRDALVERIRLIDGHADIWGVFQDPQLFREVVEALARPWETERPTKVVSVESRGFIVAAPAAHVLGAGFVGVRKGGGLFPGEKLEIVTEADYRGERHRLRLQASAIGPDDRVVMVDDWCETGAQALALQELVGRCSARFLGLSVIVGELPEETAAMFRRYEALVNAQDLRRGDRR